MCQFIHPIGGNFGSLSGIGHGSSLFINGKFSILALPLFTGFLQNSWFLWQSICISWFSHVPHVDVIFPAPLSISQARHIHDLSLPRHSHVPHIDVIFPLHCLSARHVTFMTSVFHVTSNWGSL